jgi:hypothetical protein
MELGTVIGKVNPQAHGSNLPRWRIDPTIECMSNPAVVLVSGEHLNLLVDEFGRYTRDYTIQPVRTAAEALAVSEQITAAGGQVAMYVADSRLA